MALFDRYVMVDWSAASRPVTGPDSIWLGLAGAEGATAVENLPTRQAARARVGEIALAALAAGRRLLIGFDFPFGYPAGVARHVTGRDGALALWRWIAARLRDGPDNANNRFEVAAEINRLYPGVGPFWGRPATWDHPDIPTKGRERRGDLPPDRRLVEQRQRSAQPVWKLYTTGSVGSQVLTGLPAVLALRDDPRIAPHAAIWPFETGLAAPGAAVTFAEIYPSLIPPDPSETVKDAGQVRAVADWLAGLDRDGALAPLFAGPADATADERHRIATEEAWILGLEAPRLRRVASAAATTPGARSDAASANPSAAGFANPATLAAAPRAAPAAAPRPALRYVRDPAEIYRRSFEIVRAEARLDHLPAALHDTAIRLVHACGMPDITARLAWSADVAAAATAALARGAPVLCDCEAVAAMVIRRALPAGNPVICTLNDPETPDRAGAIANTRSAAAAELWGGRLAGAVVAIGNAPTALFHLLEMLDAGTPRPAAILGFPVGFVGAAESKAELARDPRGTAFLTLRGRRGGSALAAAAVNALALAARGEA